jgi:hypothetical protein
MANTYEMTDAMNVEWVEWLKGRPHHIQALADKFVPWKLYQLKSSGHRVTIVSYSEHKGSDKITLIVSVTGKYNLLEFERQVFGVPPDDLEECDLPLPGEPLGVTSTYDEVAKREGCPVKAKEPEAVR